MGGGGGGASEEEEEEEEEEEAKQNHDRPKLNASGFTKLFLVEFGNRNFQFHFTTTKWF